MKNKDKNVKASIKNLRQEHRVQAGLFVCVRGEQDVALGALADLSSNGFKLSSEKAIETDIEYELSIENPYELKANNFGNFTAKALWSKNDGGKFYETGFEFVSLSAEAKALIPNLTELFEDSY